MQKVTFKPRELPYQINEQIKYLRANIQFCGDDKKVILLTSTTANEGKSSLTLELAKSLAELGKRVLLVDGDLRRSTLKNQLISRDSAKLGLSHYLSGMAGLDDALCVTNEPVMYAMLAGPIPPNPSELLAGRRLNKLMEWGRSQFDYILVDTAPLGVVSDAAVLAPVCDGAIVVVEAGKVPYRAVQAVVQQLRDADCPVLGVILNKVENAPGRRYKYNYKKYAYQYSADGGSDEKK